MAISQTTNSTSATWSVNGVDVLSTNSTGEVSARLNGAMTPLTNMQRILQGTPVATTSGTFVDFTGIPSWAKEITVMLNGVSTNGSSLVQIQLGDSGGIENTGYLGSGSSINSAVASVNNSSGFVVQMGDASALRHGNIMLALINDTSWGAFGVIGNSAATQTATLGGSKTLSAPLDRIRITTVNGTDTFDAGSVNILIKG